MAQYRTTLTYEQVAQALDYDAETGVFHWRHRPDRSQRWNTRYAGKIAGQRSNGYWCIQLEERSAYYGARLAWLLTYREWPKEQIDHINGVRSDDRLVNLRQVSNAQNNQNRAAQRNNIDGVRGLAMHRTAGWRVRLMAHGINHDLGYFKDRDEAIAARKALEEKLHREFAPRSGTAHGTYARKRRNG